MLQNSYSNVMGRAVKKLISYVPIRTRGIVLVGFVTSSVKCVTLFKAARHAYAQNRARKKVMPSDRPDVLIY